MTREQRIEYLRIALGIQQIHATEETVDRLIETYEVLLEKRGDFTVRDASNIQAAMDKKYADMNAISQPQPYVNYD